MEVITFDYHDKDELCANCYIVIDKHKQCAVIDPSCDYDGIANYIEKNHLKLQGILLTHAHFDHMKGVKRLLAKWQAPLFVHTSDEPGLTDVYLNCSKDYERFSVLLDDVSAHLLNDEDILNILDEEIYVIHTPYHTVGSSCFYLKDSKILFSGDTLFKMTIGRADLPTSTPRNREATFKKLLALEDNVKVYPGHGRSTTIGDERRLNPFVKR